LATGKQIASWSQAQAPYEALDGAVRQTGALACRAAIVIDVIIH